MARRDDNETDREPAGEPAGSRPKLSRGEVWRLIFHTYRASFPYLLIFIAALLLATWLVTEILF